MITLKSSHSRAVSPVFLADEDSSHDRLQLRIGIHSGPVVAGVIGRKKFAFECFGDTVNTANRMQSHNDPGKIQIMRETYERIKDEFLCEPRGKIPIKGKGKMETWFLIGGQHPPLIGETFCRETRREID